MKRKQEVVADLEQQLAAHKALEHDDLKRRRQNDTKATNKRRENQRCRPLSDDRKIRRMPSTIHTIVS